MNSKSEIEFEDSQLSPTEASSPGQTPEPYVDAAEAAQFFSINRRTVMQMARQGNIPAHPVGEGRRHSWRFLLSELDSWMRNRVNSRCRPCSPNRREIQ
jgi:excisionase family DNA binding protein